MLLDRAQPDEPQPGELPEQVTHDPTQGAGTTAWQLAVKHSLEVNARQHRN